MGLGSGAAALFRRLSGLGGSRLPSALARAEALAQSAPSGDGEEGPEDGNSGEETGYSRNLPARMGFQKIWQRWSSAVRRWARVRHSGPAQLRSRVPA